MPSYQRPVYFSDICGVSDAIAKDEINVVNQKNELVDNVRFLQSLGKWLYASESAYQNFQKKYGEHKLICRTAPSIVTRSEAELFSISSPRFAYRVYFKQDSFVNARRLNKLALAAPLEWVERASDDPRRYVAPQLRCQTEKHPTVTPAVVIRNSPRCIADSLLAAPQRLLHRFQILQFHSERRMVNLMIS